MKIDNLRNQEIDILRGIGILSIVLGHACNVDVFYSELANTIRKFVYLYHLSIFVFCSGYCFKNVSLFKFLKKLGKKQYLRFILVNYISLVLAPIWMNWGIIARVSKHKFIIRIIKIFLFRPQGILTAALWFVPFLCVTQMIFYMINRLFKENMEYIFIATTVCGLLGINFVLNNKINIYYLNKSILVQPVMFAGMWYKNNLDVKKYISSWWSIVLLLFMLFFNKYTGREIELSKNLIYGGIGFFLITFSGVLFCISFVDLVKNEVCRGVLAFLGKNSFWIMTLHFMVFKIIDGVIGTLSGDKYKEILILYPFSFNKLRPIYFIMGVVVPVAIPFVLKINDNKNRAVQ